jgi:hypothetical protein
MKQTKVVLNTPVVPSADCHVCFGEHDEEIHAATISVRRWFGREVKERLSYSEAAGGRRTR